MTYPRRDIVDAIRYVSRTGCQWRALPADFPPWDTVYHYFRAWNRDGTLIRMHDALRELVPHGRGTRCPAYGEWRIAYIVATAAGRRGDRRLRLPPVPCMLARVPHRVVGGDIDDDPDRSAAHA